ncbi:hypothetical protein MTP04_34300 [Lysinibacillus sp. PLM2]|nr:hypothetical protein MTP04_34300 [Lysinibacillus sp. PLM2]
MVSKLSISKIKTYVEKEQFIFISANNIYDAKKCRIKIVCPNGHENETSWSSFAHQKCRCKKGICNVTGSKLRKNLTEIVEEIKEYGYKIIDGLVDYINNKSTLTLKCPYSHERKISYNHFKKVPDCPDCNGFRRIYTYEEVKGIFEDEGCELLEIEYLNSKTPMKYKCVCGCDEYTIRLYDFQNGVRCQRCANRESYTFDEVKELFKERGHTLVETEYKGSHVPHSYICKCGNPSQISISNLLRGVRCMECYLQSNRGENHPNWNPNLTDEERMKYRKYSEYEYWRMAVYERDKYTCQSCGNNKGGNLVAHHLDSYDWCKEKRTDINNGITLCEDCHLNFHGMYGFGNNTNKQFSEWLYYNKVKHIL